MQVMPLHDWKDERGWDGVHLLWLAQMLDWIQPRLPFGFRAYVGSVPALTLEAGQRASILCQAPQHEPETRTFRVSMNAVLINNSTSGVSNGGSSGVR